MWGLIYKELVQGRKNIISIIISEGAMSLLMLMPSLLGEDSDLVSEIIPLLGIFVYILMFLIISMLCVGFFEMDENKRWVYFIASTPATAAGQVRTKYLCTFIMYTLLLGWSFALSKIVAAKGFQISFVVPLGLYFAMLFVHAVEFPFIVRFGSKAGSLVKTAIGLLAMLIGVEYALFGDISAFENTDEIFDLLSRLGKAGVISGVTSMLVMAFPFVALSMYLFSCEISAKLYLKGAEDY
ncbi:MAG: ABC-2 transporter permease [Oscillospiraceae bacterium]|nr:ABC-2 transporter permease [Oscillospiraceae bacterium]